MTLTTESVSLPPEWLQVPLLYPPVGMSADKELEDLKKRFPEFIPGKQRLIRAELEDAFVLLLTASKHFEEQAKLAKNWMRRELGNAEFAVSSRDHREVASRRFTPKKAYPVAARVDDSIVKARGR